MTTDAYASLGKLHRWVGLVFSVPLIVIFWMGTLSVFDREIDLWMQPTTRVPVPETVSLDNLRPRLEEPMDEVAGWGVTLPEQNAPTGGNEGLVLLRKGGEITRRPLNFKTGEVMESPQSLAGTGFIFPFHYSLHLRWLDIGLWILGATGMAMLLSLVSGLIVHRYWLRDFFNLRFQRNALRGTLDLHNVTGLLSLPFQFLITLSGLIIFVGIYFPGIDDRLQAMLPESASAFSYTHYHREPSGQPAKRQASLDRMLDKSSRIWGGGKPGIVTVHHPGDAKGYVGVRRHYPESIRWGEEIIWFDAVTGRELHRYSEGDAIRVHSWFRGLHFARFDHWPLRWLYFVLGLSGCVVIATGNIYWLRARRKRRTLPGSRIVEGLTVGSVTGIVIATLAFFVANRLLPLGASFAGVERAALEVWAFYLVWLASFAHAWLRPGQAWREQCWAIAALALLAPVLNWVTTGDHLVKTVLEGYWPVAGMDLLLLTGAGIAVYAARKLSGPSDDTVDSKAADKKAREVAG